MKPIHFLAVLPLAAIYSGGLIAEHVDAQVFGMPFLLFWNGAWAVLTSAIMAAMFRLDGSSRSSHDASCEEQA